MFIHLPVCAILTVLIVYIDVTGYSMYKFFLYYILCISNISPQSVVNFRFTIFNALKAFKISYSVWYLVVTTHIYILYKILVIFVVIYDY